MNTTIEKISPQIIALLEDNAKHLGLSVDEYLQKFLSKSKKDLVLQPEITEAEFEADMNAFAEAEIKYEGSYSRQDIYFDHD